MSLKRSARAELPRGLERPEYIEPLETLHVFGIRANYMAQFRDFLEEEGLPPDDERIEFHLPIIRNLGRQPLKTIRLRKTIHGVSTASGDAFRRNVGVDDPKIRFFETIKEIERRLGDPKVALDSFIVSRTPSHVMKKLWGIGKPDMAARHIAFQEEDRASYIGAMLRGIGGVPAVGSG